ncbi:hypothetical protein [Paenibacillus sp. FSL R5-0923]|uniref:hypothetical protein n=1 Tax=Paenibacillus sp. FSL R5-0923 TaxID=2921666 RepID=UPI0030FADCD8
MGTVVSCQAFAGPGASASGRAPDAADQKPDHLVVLQLAAAASAADPRASTEPGSPKITAGTPAGRNGHG